MNYNGYNKHKYMQTVLSNLMSSGKYFMHIQDESILMNADEPCFVLDRHAEPDF